MAGLWLRTRTYLMRTVAALLLSVLAVPVCAQDAGLGGSFITPYPDNDVYQVQVVGDWLADGLLGGLGEAFSVNPAGAQFARKRYPLTGVMRNNFDRELPDLEKTLTDNRSNIVIVMLGAQDRYTLSARRLSSGNEKWRAEFGERVDKLIKALKKGGRAVYWVGLPCMRRWQDNKRAQIMNEIIRERAYLNGARYIDSYASFIDESGGYSVYGPDITGKVRRLRYRDGVHFTDAGYRKLAHFVERDLRRDMTQARRERSVPLAGDPAEQARVNPDRARLKAEGARAKAGQKFKSKGSPIASPHAGGAVGQKAETGKVDIKVVGQGGREEVVTMEIVRPAIPAAVIALVTRKKSRDRAAQMGDILVDQIPGGLTVMSSIVPPRSASAGRRRLSPTQTPYFRVFERGERLTPKPGRADDFSWPRRQARMQVRSEPPPMPEPSP